MTIFLRVLWAESLKMKRTVALRMAVVAPVVVLLLVVFLASQAPSFILNNAVRYGSPWIALARPPFAFWAILMMPLYVTLQTALIAGLEHAENHWKSLLALPIPRWTPYLAKLLMAATLICTSTALLVLGIVLAGLVLPMLQPQLHFGSPIPWFGIFKLSAQITGLAFLSLAIQHWVSLRWRSFSVATGVGIVAMLIGYIMVLNSVQGGSWSIYFPWALPMLPLARNPGNVGQVLVISGSIGFVAAAAGCYDFCRRDVR